MRKRIVIILALVMLSNFALTAIGAEDMRKVADVTASAGDTVLLTVTLNGSAVGDTMGVSYSYDGALLEAVPEKCQWEKDSLLEDFSLAGNSGVWTSSNSADLKGDICVLAFRVKDGASFTSTQVSCEVVIKNGSKEVGTYEAVGVITMRCDHSYGPWEEKGISSHSRVCTLCGGQETASHKWDNGSVEEDPMDPSMNNKTYTCTVCGATKMERVPADGSVESTQPPHEDLSTTEPIATMPEQTEPEFVPERAPEETEPEQIRQTDPKPGEETVPDKNPETDNAPEKNPVSSQPQGGDNSSGTAESHPHDHSHEGTADVLPGTVDPEQIVELLPGEAEHDHDHDHDHDHTDTESQSTVGTAASMLPTLIIDVLLIGSLILGAIAIWRKRKGKKK